MFGKELCKPTVGVSVPPSWRLPLPHLGAEGIGDEGLGDFVVTENGEMDEGAWSTLGRGTGWMGLSHGSWVPRKTQAPGGQCSEHREAGECQRQRALLTTGKEGGVAQLFLPFAP